MFLFNEEILLAVPRHMTIVNQFKRSIATLLLNLLMLLAASLIYILT